MKNFARRLLAALIGRVYHPYSQLNAGYLGYVEVPFLGTIAFIAPDGYTLNRW